MPPLPFIKPNKEIYKKITIFHCCIVSTAFYVDWKCSKVIPFFKQEECDYLNNCRDSCSGVTCPRRSDSRLKKKKQKKKKNEEREGEVEMRERLWDNVSHVAFIFT